LINGNLSVKERDLLFKGYQKAVENICKELASFSSVQQQDLNAEYLKVFTEYRAKVEAELTAICNGAIDLIDSRLLPAAEDAEAIVFYKMM
jgi:14-3-3 protein epsilon